MKKTLLVLVAVMSMTATGAVFAKDSSTLSTTNTEAKMEANRRAAYGSMQDEWKKNIDGQKELEQKKADMQKKKDEMLAQRCTNVQERIQNRIGDFDGNKEKHMAVYTNMTDRISKFIEKLSGEGYDTAKVKADLEVLKTKIAKFSTDKDARLAALNETKSFACGKSEGEFKAKLVEARKALQLVHADAMDIRKYMLNTVRPDIQALRNQKVETKKTTDAAKTGAPELE